MNFGNPLIPTEVSALRRLNARAKPGTINLGLGQPSIDMPEELREVAAEAIRKHKLGYTPNAGRADLREKIGAHYGIDPSGVLVSHGAQEGLMAVLLALLKKGDEVLIPDPGFLAYETMVRIAGGKAKPYSLKTKQQNFVYDADKILKAVTRKTRAVLLCSPNNPTGTMISAVARKALASALAKKKIFLVSDDVYAELAFRDDYVPASRECAYAVTVSSWSKSLALTGWRIGFVHTDHPALRAKVLAAHQYLTTCASAPAQALLFEALSRPEVYQDLTSKFRKEYETKLSLLRSLLPEQAKAELPGGGFYLFVKAPAANDQKTVELLLNDGLLVVPGSYFGKQGKGWLRVSVAASEQHIRKAAALLSSRFGAI